MYLVYFIHTTQQTFALDKFSFFFFFFYSQREITTKLKDLMYVGTDGCMHVYSRRECVYGGFLRKQHTNAKIV